jgi:hypothetical protein
VRHQRQSLRHIFALLSGCSPRPRGGTRTERDVAIVRIHPVCGPHAVLSSTSSRRCTQCAQRPRGVRGQVTSRMITGLPSPAGAHWTRTASACAGLRSTSRGIEVRTRAPAAGPGGLIYASWTHDCITGRSLEKAITKGLRTSQSLLAVLMISTTYRSIGVSLLGLPGGDVVVHARIAFTVRWISSVVVLVLHTRERKRWTSGDAHGPGTGRCPCRPAPPPVAPARAR